MAAYEELTSQIDVILSRGKGSLANLCVAYHEVIDKAETPDRVRLFRYLSENFDPAESSEQLEIDTIISTNEEKVLEGRYEAIVKEMLGSVVQQNLPEDAFYEELWIAINSPFFRDPKAKAIALKAVLEDKRIPYYAIPDDATKMTNDEFKRIRKSLYKQQAKIRFLLSYKFSQKTEQADLILRELDSVTGNEKLVLMALLLKEAQSSGVGLSLLSKLADAIA